MKLSVRSLVFAALCTALTAAGAFVKIPIPPYPVPMTLQVVEGFKEALTTMPVGAKWKLFLPSKLAYGEERRSADIGPNCTLIFELELVKIQDAPPAPEGGMPFPMPQGGAPGGQPEE